MRLCWYSKCAMNVFSPSLCSSQLGTFESSKPKYLSGDKVFVYCLRVPCLSVWESCLSPVTPSHITCIFLPSPVSWLYWQLSWNVQGHRVSLWATKSWFTPSLCPDIPINWDRARGYPTIEKKIFIWFDNNKKLWPADWIDLKLILTKAGGEMWQFWIDLQVFYSTAPVN